MATVAKLMNDGEFKLAGNIDTRLPLVTDGLITHYPMDGTTKGIANFNVLDYSTWVIGTSGTQVGFTLNGDGNSIIEGFDPFGNRTALWRTLGNDVDSGADGGWNGASFPIDASKLYRFSVWIKRKVQGNGTYYLGTHGYGTTDGVTSNDSATWTAITNPYFHATNWAYPLDEWYLVVGHVHPHDNTIYGDHIDSGMYLPFNSTKVRTISHADYRWHSSTTSANHRSYLFYSTLPETDQQWAYPRVDLCDGTEPSIEDLLNGEGNITNPIAEVNTTKTFNGIAIEEGATNYLMNGAFKATDVGNWLGSTVTYGLDETTGIQTMIWDSSSGSYVYTRDEVLDDDLVTLSETRVTFSLYLRRIEGPATGRLRTYSTPGTGYNYQTVAATQEFQKFSMKSDVLINPTRIFCMIDNTGGGTYEWHSAQLELNPFETEYTDVVRGDGFMDFPIDNIDPYEGSFVLKFNHTPHEYSDTSYIDMLDFTTLSATNRFLILRKNPIVNRPSHMYIRLGSSWHYAVINSLITNDENTLVWAWKVGEGYTLYVNGAIVKTNDSYTLADTWIDTYRYRFKQGWTVKDHSVYNRRLTDDEVIKITKGTHSIRNINTITGSIQTENNLGDTYFPLSTEGKDYYKDILPTNDTNTVYDNFDGGVFVGVSMNNEVLNHGQVTSPWSGDGSPTLIEIDPDMTFRGRKVTKFHPGTSGNCYINGSGDLNTTNNSTEWTFTCYIKRVDNAIIPSISSYLYVSGNTNLNATIPLEEVEGGWYKLTLTRNGLVSGYPTLAGFWGLDQTEYYIANWQAEPTSYATPFIEGSRGQSLLKYSLPDIIGSEKDWTVSIFTKGNPYIISGVDSAARSAVISVGEYYVVDHSDISWGYRWNAVAGFNAFQMIGYNNRVGEYSSSIPLTEDEVLDCCLWTLRYNSTTNLLTGTVITKSNTHTVTKTRTLLGLSPVIYVGGYSWATGCWVEHLRDLIVNSGELSDAELESIFKTKMKAYQDGLVIQKNINTGQVL